MEDMGAKRAGKVYVVGLGPGHREHLTLAAIQAIEDSQVVVGYRVYLDLIQDLLAGKEVVSSGMGQELERCRSVLETAKNGKNVALVSGGDPGIYGMAGPMMELVCREGFEVEVRIIPGITAASMAAALLGAPLMHDLAFISLSDLLTPWEVIEKRLRLAAEADFVTALYNPRSHGRPHYLAIARDIFLQMRRPDTPVGIVHHAARLGEEKTVTTLEKLPVETVDMFSLVIIGSSQTYRAGEYLVTPRGYAL